MVRVHQAAEEMATSENGDGGEAERLLEESGVEPIARGEPRRGEEENAEEAEGDVGVEPDFQAMRRADFDEDDAEGAACHEEEPTETCEQRFLVKAAKQKKEDGDGGEDAETGVEKNGDGVGDVGGGESVEINGGDGKNKNA